LTFKNFLALYTANPARRLCYVRGEEAG